VIEIVAAYINTSQSWRHCTFISSHPRSTWTGTYQKHLLELISIPRDYRK